MKKISLGTADMLDISVDLSRSVNQHFMITGISGSGKSCAGQKLIRNIANAGGTVIVPDMHRLFSSENILPSILEDILLLSNEINVFDDGLRLPLFTPLALSSGRVEDDEDTVLALTEIFSKALTLGSRQEADLRRAIDYVLHEDLFRSQGIAALSDALSLIDSTSAICVEDKLRPLLKRNAIRDGSSIKSEINILRLSDFDLDTQAVLVEVLLSYLWRKAQSGSFIDSPVWFFCDECQNLNWGKTGILPKILSEGRKLGLNLLLITQEAESPQYRAFTQASTQLYFRPGLADINRISKRISSSRWGDTALTLRTLKVGECLAIGTLSAGDIIIQRPLRVRI